MHKGFLMLHDWQYAWRTFRQNPGFALTAIISIALGVGANAAIFSLADGLLLRPLPVPHAGQVVTLRSRTPSGTFGAISYADYADFRDRNQSFSGLVAYALTPFGFAADAKSQAQLKVGFVVSGNFFRVLGTEPALGRGFRPEEGQAAGRDAVLVLGVHDAPYDVNLGDTKELANPFPTNFVAEISGRKATYR